MNNPDVPSAPVIPLFGSARGAARKALSLVVSPETADAPASLRGSLRTLQRVRSGWRPGTLHKAARAERWRIAREGDAAVYQFTGWLAGAPSSSLTIATALAVDPGARCALLFPNTWIALGEPSQPNDALDPSDVLSRAEVWLLEELRSEAAQAL